MEEETVLDEGWYGGPRVNARAGEWERDRVAWNLPRQPALGPRASRRSPEESDEASAVRAAKSGARNGDEPESTERTGIGGYP
jgi:hypothetical protein